MTNTDRAARNASRCVLRSTNFGTRTAIDPGRFVRSIDRYRIIDGGSGAVFVLITDQLCAAFCAIVGDRDCVATFRTNTPHQHKCLEQPHMNAFTLNATARETTQSWQSNFLRRRLPTHKTHSVKTQDIAKFAATATSTAKATYAARYSLVVVVQSRNRALAFNAP